MKIKLVLYISSVPSTETISVPLEFGTMTSAPHKIRPMTGVHENQTGTISSVLGERSSVPTKIGITNWCTIKNW